MSIVELLRSKGIEPIASCPPNYRKPPSIAIDYKSAGERYFFDSEYSSNQWWRIDFKHTVLIGRYTMYRKYEGGGFLYNWDAQVSLNGIDWITVDSQRNNKPNRESSFNFTKQYQCRYFQIKGAGLAYSRNDERVVFNWIKFYGEISNFRKSKHRQKLSNDMLSSSSISILALLLTRTK